jgi:tRNA(adenine34) deaminase
MNPNAGCAGSVINLLDMAGFNHQCEVIRGVLGEETSSLLTNFFKDLRVEKAAQKEAEKADTAAEENEESKE